MTTHLKAALLAALIVAAGPPAAATAQEPESGSGRYVTSRGMVLRVDHGPAATTVTLVAHPYNRCFRRGDVAYRLVGAGPVYRGTSLRRNWRDCSISSTTGQVKASLRPENGWWTLRIYGRPVLVARGPKPIATACDDDQLTDRHGIAPGAGGRNTLAGLDHWFEGESGKRLRALVEEIAAAVGTDPGSLAITAVAENDGDIFLRPGPVESIEAGLDYWGSLANGIRNTIPAAAGLYPRQLDEHFINNNGRDTGPKFVFANGRDALLGVAAHLRRQELLMPPEYAQLSAGVRFGIIRLLYNAGPRDARRWAARADAETAFLKPTGVIDPDVDARRVATVRGGQAVHLSQRFFGTTLPCA